MKLGVCAQVFYGMPFRAALSTAARLGFEAIELPVDRRNPYIDLDAALAGGYREIAAAVAGAGLQISALSNHQEGQLLLGPHHRDTDPIFDGDAAAKAEFARKRLLQTIALAELLEVRCVLGFTGCEDYSRWFPWPDPDGYERMTPIFVERMTPILEQCARSGVRFGHECHPKQFAYNIETALLAVEAVGGHQALGFNLDPANLLLAGVDPVVFVAELGDRVIHVHAKDGELVEHNARRSGLNAHGRWDRRDRGFRFRIPGWGDVPWRRLLTELHMAGFDGVLAVEHEDPTVGRIEGLEKAIAELRPLLLQTRPDQRWW